MRERRIAWKQQPLLRPDQSRGYVARWHAQQFVALTFKHPKPEFRSNGRATSAISSSVAGLRNG
jgi:hypothetical protein